MQTIYRDHTITVNDKHFRFGVEGPALDGLQWHDSYRQATEDVDKAVAAQQRQNKVALALDVVDETAADQTIRGIHAGTSEYLGIPKRTSYSRHRVYPRVPWLIEVLRERLRLRQRISQIEEMIGRFEITGGRGYGRVDAEKHDLLVAALQSDWQTKTDAAIREAPASENAA